MKNKTVEQYEEIIENMVQVKPLPEIDVRAININTLNEKYLSETGNNLPSHLLSRLTDWYLTETLKDKSVDKVTNTERPILSHRQLKRRYNRENSSEDNIIDYLHQKKTMMRASLNKTLKKEVD